MFCHGLSMEYYLYTPILQIPVTIYPSYLTLYTMTYIQCVLFVAIINTLHGSKVFYSGHELYYLDGSIVYSSLPYLYVYGQN